MRPYILAPNAALYFGPECGPIFSLQHVLWRRFVKRL
jgi:hypothetical protein